MRAWARDHGHDVGQKGRIASAIREAYAAAHK
ncbi:Lsr2 family protein [Knoellia locipacati]